MLAQLWVVAMVGVAAEVGITPEVGRIAVVGVALGAKGLRTRVEPLTVIVKRVASGATILETWVLTEIAAITFFWVVTGEK